jgi:hypothetical protein
MINRFIQSILSVNYVQLIEESDGLTHIGNDLVREGLESVEECTNLELELREEIIQE